MILACIYVACNVIQTVSLLEKSLMQNSPQAGWHVVIN